MDYSWVQLVIGVGLAAVIASLQFMGFTMPSSIAWSGFTVGILLILWGILQIIMGPQRFPIGPIILFIICAAGISGSVAWYRISNLSKTDKILLSINRLYGKDFLFWKVAFSNETNKQCIIESLNITTFNLNDLLLLNKSDDNNLENNYKNMFDKHKMVIFPSRVIKQYQPARLEPGELWYCDRRDQFFYSNEWSKIHESKDIIRIPVGLMIKFIDFSRQSKIKYIAPFAELSISKEGKIDHILSFSREDNLLID